MITKSIKSKLVTTQVEVDNAAIAGICEPTVMAKKSARDWETRSHPCDDVD
jgi:hypothetical protein